MLESQALEPDAVAGLRNIMAREGTDEATLIQRDIQVPLRWFREVYPDLDVDRATALGIAFAGQAQVTSFGPLSVPLVSAGSVAEIVELLTYLPLITTAINAQIHPNDHGLTVGLWGHTTDRALDCLALTYAGAALMRLLGMLVRDAPIVTLHLSWPTPVGLTDLENDEVLAGRLFFDAPMSYLHVPVDTLDEVCRFADPVTYRLAVAQLRRTLDQRSGSTSISEEVRSLLETSPGHRSSQWVADKLSISTSTLKRRLSEEGTSFGELRQSCLRESAMMLLLTRSMSATQIATELGYGDLANFSHAFKRWTGRSPSEFRRSQR
ncbi:helix-turn-helix domain-containing protein [Mycolicibacterium aubagnense]|uniref:HTH-type transcriptional regulator AraC n=2 Tax=Mycolicibacterium aubagnense TaxID=319707 RepID=A0ABM7IN99_9MYCO|nr:AraC family transcriptional regulator [Mycolicibacterium aubagnense]BBX88286.1 putative HTH-type transcriptional regulator AraC [Mycolicibacterium aubagnense]